MKKLTAFISFVVFIGAVLALAIAISEYFARKRGICDCDCFDDEMFDSEIDFEEEFASDLEDAGEVPAKDNLN